MRSLPVTQAGNDMDAPQLLLSAPGQSKPLVVTSPNKIGPYLIKQKIGEGGFSNIRVALDTDTGLHYACKIVPKKRLHEKQMDSFIVREVGILEKLNHPSVIKFVDVLQDSLNYYIIMELCECRTLFEFIFSQGKLDERVAKVVFKEICDAVKYVHSLGIAHRDLKPENILINDHLDIKLIDFGLSEYCRDLISSKCGSCSYQSPESLKQGPFDGIKSDMWSLGVVLYAMVFGHLPWTRRTHQELVQQIKEAQFFVPISVSTECREMIMGMMEPDVDKRWTIDRVLTGEWLRDVAAKRMEIGSHRMPFPRSSCGCLATEFNEENSAKNGEGRRLLRRTGRQVAKMVAGRKLQKGFVSLSGSLPMNAFNPMDLVI